MTDKYNCGGLSYMAEGGDYYPPGYNPENDPNPFQKGSPEFALWETTRGTRASPDELASIEAARAQAQMQAPQAAPAQPAMQPRMQAPQAPGLLDRMKAKFSGTPAPVLNRDSINRAGQQYYGKSKDLQALDSQLGFSHGGHADELHNKAATGALNKFHEMMNKENEVPKFDDGGSYDWSGYDYSDPFYSSGFNDYSNYDYTAEPTYSDPSYYGNLYDSSYADVGSYSDPYAGQYVEPSNYNYADYNYDPYQYNNYVDSNYWDNGGWGQDQTFSDYYGGTDSYSPYTGAFDGYGNYMPDTYTGAQSPYSTESSYNPYSSMYDSNNAIPQLGTIGNVQGPPGSIQGASKAAQTPNLSGLSKTLGSANAGSGSGGSNGSTDPNAEDPNAQDQSAADVLAMRNLTPGIVGGSQPIRNIDLSWHGDRANGGIIGYEQAGQIGYPSRAPNGGQPPLALAQGGLAFMSEGGMDQHYVEGGTPGDGTEDDVNAKLSNGEFVIPADVVAGLGNGDNEAGARVLDEFLQIVREHKQENGGELPPDSKGALAYVAQAQEEAGE